MIGFGQLVGMLDIVHEFADQIGHRGEDAARDHVPGSSNHLIVMLECEDALSGREITGREGLALEDRKIDLDLIEPAGMHRQMNEDKVGPSSAERSTAVVHDDCCRCQRSRKPVALCDRAPVASHQRPARQRPRSRSSEPRDRTTRRGERPTQSDMRGCHDPVVGRHTHRMAGGGRSNPMPGVMS